MITAQDRLQRYLSRIENDESILPSNRKKILEFIKDRKIKGNAPNTLIKYLYPLHQMISKGWIKKDFGRLDKKDIQEVLNNVENEEWAAKTKKNFRLTLKVFYRWLEGEENFAPNEYPDRVKFITTTIPKRERKEISFVDIVSREEIIKMVQQSLNPMHRAFLWVAFESGGRPEELLNMTSGSIKFDNNGAIVYLKGAKSRRPVRLISATEPLREWLRKHPLNKEDDFPIWVTQFNKKRGRSQLWTKLGSAGANKIVKVSASRCGMRRRLTLYSLRRGRATELAAMNVPRSVMHMYMGWEEGSSISKSYVKLSMQDMDNSILKASGIEVTDDKPQNFIECSFCGTRNSPDSLYCQKENCNKPLIIGDIQKELKGLIGELRGERRSLVKELFKDPEFEKMMMEKYENWKASKEISQLMKPTRGF